ncbi:putative flavanone 3-dioxygenase [Helianthus anomalus]
MKLLAQKVLGLISESLGLSSSFMEDAMGELYQNITISYYLACPESHSDFGFITLLIQDNVGGLQVVKDVEWVTVDPVSHAVLVILGDQTKVLHLEFSLLISLCLFPSLFLLNALKLIKVNIKIISSVISKRLVSLFVFLGNEGQSYLLVVCSIKLLKLLVI